MGRNFQQSRKEGTIPSSRSQRSGSTPATRLRREFESSQSLLDRPGAARCTGEARMIGRLIRSSYAVPNLRHSAIEPLTKCGRGHADLSRDRCQIGVGLVEICALNQSSVGAGDDSVPYSPSEQVLSEKWVLGFRLRSIGTIQDRKSTRL